MHIRSLAIATIAAASFGFAANAQESAPMTPPAEEAMPPAAETAATPSSATVGTEFKPGSPVEDAAGGAVGAIESVTEGDTGPVVVVKIDGALYGLPANSLSTTSGKVVSNQTKAQIKAASKPSM